MMKARVVDVPSRLFRDCSSSLRGTRMLGLTDLRAAMVAVEEE